MLEIDQKIIDKAHGHCPKWEVCLTGTLRYSCKVIECDSEQLLVEPTEKSTVKHCPRNVHIESIYVCLCPIRKEIYKKYNM